MSNFKSRLIMTLQLIRDNINMNCWGKLFGISEHLQIFSCKTISNVVGKVLKALFSKYLKNLS